MKALQLLALQSDFAGCRIVDIPQPEAEPGQIVISVRAAAVNFVDLLMTRGEYQTKPTLPFTLGSDVAGEIVAVGDGVNGFVLGQAVMGMRMGGAFSEFASLPVAAVKPKPEALSFEQAAAYGAPYYTAYVALIRRAALADGEWLLVQGATGGVGLAAVDLGKVLGARVIAGSASSDKLAIVEREFGADAVIDVTRPFRERVKEITDGGADVIYDPVGGDVFDESVRCIAFNGRYLVIGFTSGRIPEIGVNIPLIKGFSVVGVRAGEYGRRFPDHGEADRQAVWELANQGQLNPRVHAALPLADWRHAFALMEARQAVGRVVLLPGEGS